MQQAVEEAERADLEGAGRVQDREAAVDLAPDLADRGQHRGDRAHRMDLALARARRRHRGAHSRSIRSVGRGLREELTLAQIDHHAEAVDELDVQGILANAERVLPRASDLWVQASLDYKQTFAAAVFSGRDRVTTEFDSIEPP